MLLQHDEFAINQLLNTVQNQGLNEVYQDLFSRKEAYLEEKSSTASIDQNTADTVENVSNSQVSSQSLDFDSLKEAKIAAKKNPINIAAAATAMVIRVAKKSSSPQPVSP